MKKTTNDYIAIYKKYLQQGDIQIAYEKLVKYVMTLRAHFLKVTNYSVGNVSPGYLDFTYFPFFDKVLRDKKLRFGIVLNHQQMRFELWLMGQNADVQKAYWDILKTTKWNKDVADMPKYSVLEVVLIDNIDFNDVDGLTATIEKNAMELVEQISPYL